MVFSDKFYYLQYDEHLQSLSNRYLLNLHLQKIKDILNNLINLQSNSLPQQLYRGLSTIDFDLGHVHIINEKQELLACWSAKHSFFLSLKLGLEDFLGTSGAGLGGEVERGCHPGT